MHAPNLLIAGLISPASQLCVRFIDPDANKRTEQVELLKRYIDLAATMGGAANIRIFGDRVPSTPVEVSQTLDWEADGIRECDGLAGDAGVALC